MAPRNVDRRVRRTRALLLNAAQELVVEKGYDAMTVQDILDRADVGRSTFYAHFRDKDDLLLSGFEIVHVEVDETMAAAGRTGVPSVDDIALANFHYAAKNPEAYRTMISGSRVMRRQVRHFLGQHIRDELDARGITAKDPAVVDAVVEFQASSMLSLISWWLDTGMTLSPEQMHDLFVRLITPGVEAVLG
jgi:AcrR family transcriptional regulator